MKQAYKWVALPVTSLVLLCLASILSVQAQTRPGTQKVAPPSFSNSKTTAKQAAKHQPVKISSEDLADAILGNAIEEMYEAGDEFFHIGEWNHCINLYRVVENGDPHNVETYCNVAFLLWSSDRNAQAIDQLKLGLSNNPDTFYMYDELGSHYWLRLKDPVTALPYYEKAVKFQAPWSTYHNLAFVYQKLNRWQEAVDTWKQSTKFGDDRVAPIKLKQAEAHLKQMSGK
jgi:tetratricopeptide (TPR) repeat protein